jgi:hypothetical protein
MTSIRTGVARAAALAAILLLAACYDDTPQMPETLILTLSADSAPADGSTLVRAEARTEEEDESVDVTFSTTRGGFVGAEAASAKVPTVEGLAVAELRSPTTPGVARVRVVRGTAIREDSVLFVRARAQSITVEAERFALAAGIANSVNVTATLRRGSGAVTAGEEVTFRAREEGTGILIGQFSTPTPSDASGRVTVRFSAGDTSYRGPVRITATYGSDPSAISASVVIQITGSS